MLARRENARRCSASFEIVVHFLTFGASLRYAINNSRIARIRLVFMPSTIQEFVFSRTNSSRTNSSRCVDISKV